MIHLGESAVALLLLVVANTAAWAAGRICGSRWSAPLDLGLVLGDGRRLLGEHKTWRGALAGTGACAVAAALLGCGPVLGLGFGAASLAGDALASGFKRRLRLAPGTEMPGLDQLPEALLPLVIFARALGLGAVDIAAVAILFTLLDLASLPFRHRD